MTPIGFAEYVRQHLSGLRGQNTFVSGDTYRFIHFGQKGFSFGVVNGDFGGISFLEWTDLPGFFCRAVLIFQSDLAFTIMTNAGSGTAQMKVDDRLTMQIVKKLYNRWWKFWL